MFNRKINNTIKIVSSGDDEKDKQTIKAMRRRYEYEAAYQDSLIKERLDNAYTLN